jgi:hypothetical protein
MESREQTNDRAEFGQHWYIFHILIQNNRQFIESLELEPVTSRTRPAHL